MHEDEGHTSNIQRPKYQFYSDRDRKINKWQCHSGGYRNRNEEKREVSRRIEKEIDQEK